MLLRGQNQTLFEVNVLRYEHPGAKNDNWKMNVLRLSVFVRYADEHEGKCITYVAAGELKELKGWLEKLLRKERGMSYFECYSGVFRFDFLDYGKKGASLRVSFSLSGKGSQLPDARDEVFGWVGKIDFSLSFAQIAGGIAALEQDLLHFPVRRF